MRRILFVVVCALLACVQATNAQNYARKLKYPSAFVGVQGGARTSFYTFEGRRLTDNVTPIGSVYVGAYFTPVVGARLHFSGYKAKEALFVKPGNYNYEYDYWSPNLDLMLNLTNAFSDSDVNHFNIILLGGLGVLRPYGESFCDYNKHSELHPIFHDAWMLNTRLGLQLSYAFNEHFDIHAEADVHYADNFTSHNVFGSERWNGNLFLGLGYKFARKVENKVVELPVNDARVLSLYEQMQAEVSNRMNNYMKRAKGESKVAYQLRTSPDSLDVIRLKFEEEVSTEMAGDLINRSGAKFGRYSRKNSLATVDFEGMPSIVVDMNRDEMMATKAGGTLKFRNTKYRITPNNEYEIIYTEIESDGKAYTYDNTATEMQAVKNDGDFMDMKIAQRTVQNEIRLDEIKEQTIQQARKENVLTDNTLIQVTAEPIATANGKYDYKVTYSYEVKDGFSAHDDFGPGKYEADKSNASVAMLTIIKEAFATSFSDYLKPGSPCRISFVGTADALPIRGSIAYNGKYGDIVQQKVNVNGEEQVLSVTQRSGIRSNEQLSLVRAVSVKNFVEANVPALKKMKVDYEYSIEVSDKVGGQHRRVKVEFYFPAAM